MNNPMRVLLVDDHPLFRAGVIALLRSEPGIELCGETGDAATARVLAARTRPDCAIIDLLLQDDDGLKLVRELRRDFPGLRIIVLSMLDPALYQARALQAGAGVFVSKQSGPEAVLTALRGTAPRAPRITSLAAGLALLTERELQVFQQLGLGRSTQEIATALGVSGKTIESHRENIKGKLGLPHANALVARAALWLREQGLLR